MKVRQSVFINLPTRKIFDYISDFENLAAWSNVVIAARKISPGTAQVGAMLCITIRFLGKWQDMKFEIVEYVPGRYLTIKSISGIASGLFCYQLEPVKDGGTTLSLEAAIHFPQGETNLATPVVTRAVDRQLTYDLQTLKDILETA